jgi:hypothetical protein
MPNTAYPFDPTGNLLANKIVNEQQILTATNFRDYHFIVPKWAPYFSDSLVIKHRALDNTERFLVEGIDYYCSHWFISASRACAKPIYGSISFLNTSLAGVITLTYQTLGGIWTLDTALINQILADSLNNPRTTAWDAVSNMPTRFPPIDHEWDLIDMVGATQLAAAIAGVESALRQTGTGGIENHLVNLENPHQTTKAQVGLGSVLNYGLATTTEAQTGAVNNKYMTPALSLAQLQFQALTPLSNHTGNTSNPHATTAAQVGAFTKQEVNTLLDTKLGTTAVAFDTNRFDTRSPIEYRDWVLLGTTANSLRFAGLTFGEAKANILTGTALNSTHLDGRTYDEIIAQVSSGVATDTVKFAGYSFAQATAQILLGTAANSTLFGGKTYLEAQTEVLAGTAANANQFAGLTFAQATATILAGKAADSDRFDGKTYAQLLINLDSSYTNQNAYPPIDLGPDSRWLNFGVISGVDGTTIPSDLLWLVAGSDTDTASASSTFLLQLTFKDIASPTSLSMRMIATRLTGTSDEVTFGYTYSAGLSKVTLWVKTPGKRSAIHFTELTRQSNIDMTSVATVTAEPAGSVRALKERMALGSEIDLLRSDLTALAARVP